MIGLCILFLSIFLFIIYRERIIDIAQKEKLELSIRQILEESNWKDLKKKQIEARDYDEEIKHYQKIANNFPGTPKAEDAVLGIANAYIQKKEYNMAIREYQKVIDNYSNSPKVPGAYGGIALCYERLRDYDQAQKIYKMIIKKYPNSKIADAAHQHIKDLKNPAYIKTLEILNKELEE